MRQTIRFGRIAGIPIGSHWSVLVILVLLVQMLALTVLPQAAPGDPVVAYWAVAAVVAVLFLVALLAHELGHALVARRYGVRVRGITLWLLGGVSELDGQAPHARGDLLIAVIGPLVSLTAAGVFALLALGAAAVDGGALAVAALTWLAVINVVLAAFNLLPGAPLDGGRVLAAALWWGGRDRTTARRAANRAGIILGAVLTVGGFALLILTRNLGGLWLVLIGWFLIVAANAENSDVRSRDALGNAPVRALMTDAPVSGYTHQSVTDFITTVARSQPHRTYPVSALDGRLSGLVSLARLARVPVDRRRTTSLADVQIPRDRILVVHPDTPLAEVRTRLLASGQRLAPVLVGEQVVGVVSSDDLARAVDLATLGVWPERNIPAPPST